MNQEPSPRLTDPTPDTHDGFMLERPLNLPTSGATRNDMRSDLSFQVLEELTGADVLSLRTQTYEQERNFWRGFFETTRNAPQDQYTHSFLRERAQIHLDRLASKESISLSHPESVTVA